MGKKIKSFNEAHLFVDTTHFLEELLRFNRQISRDDRICFGNDIVINTKEFLKKFRIAYDSNDLLEKQKYVNEMLYHIRDVETAIKILFTLKIYNITTFSLLNKYLGLIEKQVNGWIKKIDDDLTSLYNQ